MSTLVDLAISAHGGMDRRKRLSTVSAHLGWAAPCGPSRGRRALWAMSTSRPSCARERASFGPFQSPDRRTAFTPDRVAIETTGGAGLDERHDPHSSFAVHVRDLDQVAAIR